MSTLHDLGPVDFNELKRLGISVDWSFFTQNGITIYPDGTMRDLSPGQRELIEDWLAEVQKLRKEIKL